MARCSSHSPNTNAAVVDGELIERVEELLDRYFNDESLAVAGSDGDAHPEVRSLQRSLLVEAMHVRGEGTPEMVRFLARGIYSPHADWFMANLGFTCDDAIEIADRIFATLLKHLDRLPDVEATDAAAFLLGLSDRQLQQVGELWLQTEEKTKADGQFHTISALPAPGGGGFTILCGRGTEDELQRLQVLCLVNKYKHHAPIWLGIGAVPGGEATPFAVTLDARQWVPDPELDRLFPVWPLPGKAAENPSPGRDL